MCLQEMMHERKIALAINVKASSLAHIARCSGAQVASHLDNLSSANIMHCDSFRIEDVNTRKVSAASPNSASPQLGAVRRKTLMHLQGTKEGLACTVLLRGACESELVRLKRVMRFAVFAAYCARLEVALLADVLVSLAATLPRGDSNAPPPLGDGDTVRRTWEEWAAALGHRSAAGERPVLSVSPYVQKWQVDADAGGGRSGRAAAGRGGGERSGASSVSDASTSAAAAGTETGEAERREMARVYYERTTQVCRRRTFGGVRVLLFAGRAGAADAGEHACRCASRR